MSSNDQDRALKITNTDVEITSDEKKIKKYVPLSKRQDKPDSVLWLIKNYPQLKDSQIAKLVVISNNSVTGSNGFVVSFDFYSSILPADDSGDPVEHPEVSDLFENLSDGKYSLRDLITGRPKVMLGTKLPSMTSK